MSYRYRNMQYRPMKSYSSELFNEVTNSYTDMAKETEISKDGMDDSNELSEGNNDAGLESEPVYGMEDNTDRGYSQSSGIFLLLAVVVVVLVLLS